MHETCTNAKGVNKGNVSKVSDSEQTKAEQIEI